MNRVFPVLLCCIVLFSCFLPVLASAATVTAVNTINIYSNDGSELLFRIVPDSAVTLKITDYGVTILNSNGSTAGGWLYEGEYLFNGIATGANASVGGLYNVYTSGDTISIPAAAVKDITYNYYVVEDTDQSVITPTIPDKYNSSRIVNIYSNNGEYLLHSYILPSELEVPPAVTVIVNTYGVEFAGGVTVHGWDYTGSYLFVGLSQLPNTTMVSLPIGGQITLDSILAGDCTHNFYIVVDYEQAALVRPQEQSWWDSVLGWFESLGNSITNLTNTIIEYLRIPQWITSLYNLVSDNFIVDAFTSLWDWVNDAINFFSLPDTFSDNGYTFWDYLFGATDDIDSFFSWYDDIALFEELDSFFSFVSSLWLLIPKVIRYLIIFSFGFPFGIGIIVAFLR